MIGFHFGIEYEDLLGHRGLSPSLAAAVAMEALLAWAHFRGVALTPAQCTRAFVVLALCTASHAALDALTNRALRIAFFAPFDNSRYFFAWRPIEVAPIAIAEFSSAWGLAVLRSEVAVVSLPCASARGDIALVRRTRGQRGAMGVFFRRRR